MLLAILATGLKQRRVQRFSTAVVKLMSQITVKELLSLSLLLY